MSKIYVIVEYREQTDRLMKPFDIERIVPTINNINAFIKQEKKNLEQFLFHIEMHFTSKEEFYKQYNTKQQEHYRKHVLVDIPLYLSNTEKGDNALWEYIKYHYGIDDSDLLPDNNFIRRFNPNGKWDYYTINQQPKTSQRVGDNMDTLTSTDTSLLLPNYLWINQNDPKYSEAIRQNFLEQFKECRFAIVEFYN